MFSQRRIAAAWMDLHSKIPHQFGNEPSNAHVHLEGLSKGFHLTSYPLLSEWNWTPNVMPNGMTAPSAAARVFPKFGRMETSPRSNKISDTISKAKYPLLTYGTDVCVSMRPHEVFMMPKGKRNGRDGKNFTFELFG